MAKLILSKSSKNADVTSQLSLLYRLSGLMVLCGALFVLFYPVITGEKIIHRGQLDLQFFSLPGIFLSMLAFMNRKVSVDLTSSEVMLCHRILSLTIYKKTYQLSFFDKILLDVDAKPPSWSATGTHHNFVKPWYHVVFISYKTQLGTELLVVKSVDPAEAKNIAAVFSEYTKLPLETGLHYPALP